MESIYIQKASIRKEILRIREGREDEDLRRMSRKIADHLFGLGEFQNSGHVLFYLSLEKEVRTDEMIGQSLNLGKSVYVPLVDKREGHLKISRLLGLDIEFQKGCFGIREPAVENLERVPPLVIDFVVAPGLAFDRKGGRIGFGSGYYDRFLGKIRSDAVCIALGFDFQVLDSVPQLEHDVRVRKIVTETGIINCR